MALTTNINALRKCYGITQLRLSDILCLNVGTIRKWENGTTRIPNWVLRYGDELVSAAQAARIVVPGSWRYGVVLPDRPVEYGPHELPRAGAERWAHDILARHGVEKLAAFEDMLSHTFYIIG